jgi:hypothetical protein
MADPPEGWISIATAANEYQAHLIRGALEDEEIKVVLEPFASGAGAYLHAGSDPTAPVRILVPRDREDEANGVLVALDAEVGTVEADLPAEVDDVPNDVFAERRAGTPMKLLVLAAVVVAVIVGLAISGIGPFDF